MPTPAQPTVLKDSSGTALTSGGSLNNRDFYVFGMAIHNIDTRGLPPIRQRRQPRAGAHGQVFLPEFYDSRPLVVSGQMTADTHAALIENQEAAKTFLNTFRRDTPAPLRLIDPMQTDRYYECHYDGVCIFGDPSPREIGTICDFTFSVIADPPFALSLTLSDSDYQATAGLFQSIATGTFESEPRIIWKGAATNPKMVFGDLIFRLPFDNYVTDAKGIENNTISATFSGTAAQKAALFSPSSHGLGHAFYLNGAYTMPYALPGNKAAGTIVAFVEPQFDAPTVTSGAFICDFRYNGDNYIQLFYYNNVLTNLNRHWVFLMRIAGANYIVQTPTVQNFVSGTLVKIGIDWGSSGMRLFIDGTLIDSNLITTALAANPTTLNLHQSGANFTGNSKIHFMAVYSSQLTENEHARVADDPYRQIVNRNLVLSWTGALDADDLIEWTKVDNAYIGKKFDVSAGSVATVWPDDGTIIPPLAAENTALYHPNAIARVYLQWRNRYL